MHDVRGKPRWRRDRDAPFTPLAKPLAECRLALVASSVCLARRGQRPDPAVVVGEPRFRTVAGDADTDELRAAASAPGADAAAANLDRNVAYALDRLREAQTTGRLARLNHRHLAFGGAMVATRRAITKAAPRAATLLVADAVDVVLLVPT